MSKWRTVSADDARNHALYGVRGWLLVFVAAWLLGALHAAAPMGAVAEMAGDTTATFMGLKHPVASVVRWSFMVAVALAIIVGAMAYMKPRFFRVVATILLIASFPLDMAGLFLFPLPAEFAAGMGAELGKALLGWIVSMCVWITYLQRSKRVRVTFEHKVRA